METIGFAPDDCVRKYIRTVDDRALFMRLLRKPVDVVRRKIATAKHIAETREGQRLYDRYFEARHKLEEGEHVLTEYQAFCRIVEIVDYLHSEIAAAIRTEAPRAFEQPEADTVQVPDLRYSVHMELTKIVRRLGMGVIGEEEETDCPKYVLTHPGLSLIDEIRSRLSLLSLGELEEKYEQERLAANIAYYCS